MVDERADDDFDRLLQQVREGSQEAAWELVEKYSPYIFRVVRRRLPEKMRRSFDSEDFVQAAWASMFTHRSQLLRFSEPKEFMAFLAMVASNKVRMELRRRDGVQKRASLEEQESLDDLDPEEDEVPILYLETPSQVAVARERWFRLLAGQPPHYRRMIELRYNGATFREIAEQVGMDEGTVRRALQKILRDQDL